jgi:hypothetical protein
MKKTGLPQEGKKIKAGNRPLNTDNNIHTDYPLSEKDQVKQAEEKMRKAAKKDK